MANPTLLHGARLRENSIDQTKLTAEIRTMLSEIADKANTADLIGGDNKLLTSLLPDSVVGGMKYKGVWDAATNTPAIPAASASNAGFYYKVSVNGTTAIDGIAEWAVGDWLVSNGTSWDKIDNSEKTEEALTTHFDKTVKNLLQATNVQGALDELSESCRINHLGGNTTGGGYSVDFVAPSPAIVNQFLAGTTPAILNGSNVTVVAGQTILNLYDGRIYTVQTDGVPVADPQNKGLSVYRVKKDSDSAGNCPAGTYIVHVSAAGVVSKSRIAFADMMFDSSTQQTVKQKILDLDSNALLAARFIRRAALTGTADGTNAVFTLVGQKLIADTDEVFVDGMLQEPGTEADYVLTVSGADTVVTFNAGAIPSAGSRVRISGVKA